MVERKSLIGGAGIFDKFDHFLIDVDADVRHQSDLMGDDCLGEPGATAKIENVET